MLELLAGPFPVVDGAGDAVSLSEGQFDQTALYDDATGLASYSADLGGFCVTQIDGTTYLRSAMTRANSYVLDLPGNDWLLISALFNDLIYTLNKATGVLGTVLLDGEDVNSVIDILARAPDRFITVARQKVRARPLDLSSAFSDEYTLSGPPTSGTSQATLSRTKNTDVLCITYATGQVVYYNWRTLAQVGGVSYLPTNTGAWYSAKHDVFVVLTGTTTNAISIYANAAIPAAISAPAAAPTLKRGRRSTISVTVTGANGEPCKGELIDWALDGPGTLLAEQSETDESGVASAGYVAPLSLSTNPTFTASLVI